MYSLQYNVNQYNIRTVDSIMIFLIKLLDSRMVSPFLFDQKPLVAKAGAINSAAYLSYFNMYEIVQDQRRPFPKVCR